MPWKCKLGVILSIWKVFIENIYTIIFKRRFRFNVYIDTKRNVRKRVRKDSIARKNVLD